jgi:uncharacterized protein with HEPN domain
MSTEFLDYVEDILDAMEKAEILIENVTYGQFEADFRINFAVVRALEIVGEATKRLPPALRDEYPDIPWREMAGMRDRIIHGYDTVDLRIVWDTTRHRIPSVKPQIRQILEDYQD